MAERLQGVRDLRVQRHGLRADDVPDDAALEDLFYPNARTIAAAARDLVEGGATGWLPDERADLQSIEFKGPF